MCIRDISKGIKCQYKKRHKPNRFPKDCSSYLRRVKKQSLKYSDNTRIYVKKESGKFRTLILTVALAHVCVCVFSVLLS